MLKYSWLPFLFFCIQLSACSETKVDTSILSLESMTVDALRKEDYTSRLQVIEEITSEGYQEFHSKDGSKAYKTYMGSYKSDELTLYTRIDIPVTPMPEGGYPVVIFAHGYVGIEAAPLYKFGYEPKSYYGAYIDRFVDAGFVVLTPGYRGHGTVKGKPAGGIEFMRDWDNGSYLSPIFYAKDVLNLLGGVHTMKAAFSEYQDLDIDLKNINLTAHSQGGDAALVALAIQADGSSMGNNFRKASIWSGTFPSRFTQAETYAPMQNSPQAFLSGDGSWTGSAVGVNGSINQDFIFAYPSEWIGTLIYKDWTWQRDTYDRLTVAESVREKYEEMYAALNAGVDTIKSADFSIEKNTDGKTIYAHDSQIADAMDNIGAFHRHDLINVPLFLHYPDRDFYSIPKWNESLCKRINKGGGQCVGYQYGGNTHSMKLSKHKWFSPEGSREGFDIMIARDIEKFKSN
ncbi:hypothetical protein QGN29_01485 [Temperatibacter marinus]|uniref:Uncharacterized protein n=1 Tax=Temperatibacter marinus TaxID=1456591 RepID=A0AA52H9C1_9PROT|nr:hypothetical protein [Temperatibacter marinus]WND03036.1 hypothetical protein QGN29_01485 [Temperatibacter marinus]